MSQRKALPEKLTVAQLLMLFPVFYRTHCFNLKPHQPYPKIHVLNSNERTNKQTNLGDNDKRNPQAKLPVLHWHNQNPNITTLKMLTVLIQ